jgi:carbamoyltransferase
VLRSRCAEYFEIDAESPYMLLVAPVRHELRRQAEPLEGDDMIPVVNQVRSTVPAITHVDYSARVQTVDPAVKPDFAQVLAEFDRLTGCAVAVNTSFNVRGEPIVCTPDDSYRCFMRTEMEMLVLGSCILHKDKQPEWKETGDWRSEYELD